MSRLQGMVITVTGNEYFLKAKYATNSLESTVWPYLSLLRLESDIETFGHVRAPSEVEFCVLDSSGQTKHRTRKLRPDLESA